MTASLPGLLCKVGDLLLWTYSIETICSFTLQNWYNEYVSEALIEDRPP
jgi:hypothetical protein